MSPLLIEGQPVSTRASVPSLYVLKALLAFFVVTCHAPILLPWVKIPGMATELFFTITGYFLYSADLEKVQSRIWKSIKKVIPIMISLQLLYIPLAPPDWKSPVALFNWGFMGVANFDAVHLWYLTSLLYSLITFSLFLRCTKGKYVPLLFLCVLGWMILGDYRYFIDGKGESIYLFNFISRALPFLAMGYWIRANESVLLQRKWVNIYFFLMFVSCAENLLVYILSQGQTDGGLIEIFPLRFAFFMLILSYKELGEGTWLEVIGDKYSGSIYYYHMAVIILWEGLNQHSPRFGQVYDYAGAFVVFFIGLLIAMLIERGSRLAKRYFLLNSN